VLLEASGFRRTATIPLRGAPGQTIIEAAPM
jgi:hypothetical protein